MNMKTDDIKPEGIDPTVLAELKRLGVDDLPWCPADGGAAELRYWNDSLEVSWNDEQGFGYYNHFDKNGRCEDSGLGADGGPLVPGNGLEWFMEHIAKARARYSPQPTETQPEPSARDRLADIKPSNCSWQVAKIKALLPQLDGGTACAVSVICGQTLERSVVTGADYREALERIRRLVTPEMNNPKTSPEATEGTQDASEGSGKTSESSEDLGSDSGAFEGVRVKCLGEALEILREEYVANRVDGLCRVSLLEKDWQKAIELIEEAMEG